MVLRTEDSIINNKKNLVLRSLYPKDRKTENIYMTFTNVEWFEEI